MAIQTNITIGGLTNRLERRFLYRRDQRSLTTREIELLPVTNIRTLTNTDTSLAMTANDGLIVPTNLPTANIILGRHGIPTHIYLANGCEMTDTPTIQDDTHHEVELFVETLETDLLDHIHITPETSPVRTVEIPTSNFSIVSNDDHQVHGDEPTFDHTMICGQYRRHTQILLIPEL